MTEYTITRTISPIQIKGKIKCIKKEGRETPLLYQIVNSVSTYQINPKEPAVIPTATKKLNSKIP